MSICLAIDTSTSRTSVGLVEDGALLWHGFQDGATAHGSALPQLVSQGLAQQSKVDQVVVGMGPGPYTGLRVGIAFAISFGRARGIPVTGICSLDAIAALIHEDDFVVATDARRKEIYWARYINGVRTEGPSVDLPKFVAAIGVSAFGEGSFKYQLTTNEEFLFPDMASLVELSKNSDNKINEAMYLRRPDAVPTSERTQ
ncbi:unannotated protein [freshwater metagenome]|uniref:Unannotated protein n=1 Tax=freshwater metagenome TaxID=449393 RepID=A0A6J7M1B3_9ZZZZ|nr:tRNA (adenosine(37)-N6)-threonylcarbamoyltransferase complex dimerization subunit type 1 TsaB [Actinomycetota bacterium]MSV64236.1 tRNA (adenosine(37)-N6)-threonylcarbamoyltransferase complex dimerization subunit type 1 TsaB [Actinomycetota bacterium]MSW26206.1 tRNA (adenosine(37)-N6)-threonylcarbamoyltransferase complex dimerization subunit type 1 TsaB [Actinomycetota bacterium]MSW33982.1 tRNA (adenosine(37)-N6)-threonylcarbamoyltransferase complex dimerization subunit type 1 TsaB [Actinomyc